MAGPADDSADSYEDEDEELMKEEWRRQQQQSSRPESASRVHPPAAAALRGQRQPIDLQAQSLFDNTGTVCPPPRARFLPLPLRMPSLRGTQRESTGL